MERLGMGARAMMQQVPPPPPGFQIVGQSGAVPPPPPGFAMQAPNPARAAPSRPRPASSPMAGPQAAPAARLNDLGITDAQERDALIYQGYTPEQADAEMAQRRGDVGGYDGPAQPAYGVRNSQNISPAEARNPQLLIDQGYQQGPDGNWYRSVVEDISPARSVADPDYQTARSEGHNLALAQERETLARYDDMGIRRYDRPDFTDQLTAPFNDEMAWAAGLGTQAIGNLGRRLTGQEIEVSALDRARAMRELSLEGQEQFARERPFQAAAGQIIGGFALGPARAAGAATGAQNFLRSSQAFARPTAAQGYGMAAGAGSVYGAADADGGVGERLVGAGTGALLGLATAGVIDGGTRTAGAIGGLFRGGRPSGAENRVGQVIDRELRANRVSREDLLSSMNGAAAGSLPFNAAEGVLSPIAEALVASTGPGGRIVRNAVDAQRGGAPDRIMGRIGEQLGGAGDYFATLNRSIDTRRTAAREVIDQIGPQQFPLNADAVRSLRSDLAQGQIRQAAQNALASPDQQTYQMGANLMRLSDTLRDNPSAAAIDVRTAQDLSKALLDMSSDAWRRGDGSTGRALGSIGSAIRQNARDAVPEYGQWLQRYGDESSQIEALELGRQVFRNADDPAADGMSAEVLRGQFAEMSDTAKDMFRKGIAEAIVARARTSRGEVGAMRDLLRTSEFADRVKLAFPDEQAFTRFMNAAEAEVALANTGSAITGNSNTARRQATMQRLGLQPESQAADQLAQTTLTGLPLVAGRAGLRAAGRAMGRQRSVIENEELNELLGRAVVDESALRQLMMQRGSRRGLFGGRGPAGVAGAAPQTIPGF